MLKMCAQRNNISEAEKEYMSSIATEHGGFGRFDYVAPTSRFIYRGAPFRNAQALETPGWGNL